MEYKIKGMMCHRCEERIIKVFKEEGYDIKANFETGTITILQEIDPNEFKRIVEDAGFEM